MGDPKRGEITESEAEGLRDARTFLDDMETMLRQYHIVCRDLHEVIKERNAWRELASDAIKMVTKRWEPGGTLEGQWVPFSVRQIIKRYEELLDV